MPRPGSIGIESLGILKGSLAAMLLALAARFADSAGGWNTVLGSLPAAQPNYALGNEVQVLLRPEHLRLGASGIAATVLECKFRGSHLIYSLQLPDGQRIMAQSPLAQRHAPEETVFAQLAV